MKIALNERGSVVATAETLEESTALLAFQFSKNSTGKNGVPHDFTPKKKGRLVGSKNRTVRGWDVVRRKLCPVGCGRMVKGVKMHLRLSHPQEYRNFYPLDTRTAPSPLG